MDEQTKIMLSPREVEIAMSTELILTKQHIIHTVNNLFNEQVEVIKKVLQSATVSWPLEILKSAPRISKGENYNNLPYVMLDYPAVFSKENLFALRTMFWWANFFSVTIHLKGKYQQLFAENICNKLPENMEGIFICISQSSWDHHFETSNYLPLEALEKEVLHTRIITGDFLKLAFKLPLYDWNNTSLKLAGIYDRIANLLSD